MEKELTIDILSSVQKPARYTGGEFNSIVKSPEETEVSIALAFPDIYEVGMSYLGFKILYHILNLENGVAAERVYAPWVDLEAKMRADAIPLRTLETEKILQDFDFVGFTLQYELSYTNILNMLDLGRIPVKTEERTEKDPFIIVGGPCVYNPEPLADFFDLAVVGEGEEVMVELMEAYKKWKREGKPGGRQGFLRCAVKLKGIYVPSFYDVAYNEDGTVAAVVANCDAAPAAVEKRVISDMNTVNYPTAPIVPFGEIVHDRIMLEVFRGCSRGCRFCHAGMVYRPVRERSADQIVSSVIQGLEKTGYDEVSLTSLSTTDHSCIRDVLGRLNRRLEDTGIRVSIPSQRLDSFGVDMAESVAGEKKGGLTFAPEAGSQRMRDIINKNVTEEDLDRAAKAAFEAGWNRMKLYFMMGLPGERDEDIVAIANLADHVLELGRSVVPKARRGSISVSISVSVFIPKAATPFQWCPQLDYDDVKRRQKLLITSVRNRAVRVHYHDAETSLIEAALSRAGRDMTPVIIDAWRAGSRFDAWVEHFSLDNWKEAAAKNGIDLNELVHLPYELDWRLPWEHVSPGCSRGFLEREYRRSLEGVTTPDCTRTSCTGCGICPTLHAKNVLIGDRA